MPLAISEQLAEVLYAMLSSTSRNFQIKCLRGPTTEKPAGRHDVFWCLDHLSGDLSFFQRSVLGTLHIKAPLGIHRPDVPGVFPAEKAEAPSHLGGADWDSVQIRTKVHSSPFQKVTNSSSSKCRTLAQTKSMACTLLLGLAPVCLLPSRMSTARWSHCLLSWPLLTATLPPGMIK